MINLYTYGYKSSTPLETCFLNSIAHLFSEEVFIGPMKNISEYKSPHPDQWTIALFHPHCLISSDMLDNIVLSCLGYSLMI